MRRALTLALVLVATLLFADGGLDVVIREFDLPTPNERPHDPAVGADGALWYTAQMANKIGRLDPATGQIKEFPLKTPNSGPHGLVADKNGNIWFTANFAAYIGKLDPKTGKVTEYPMPDKTLGKDPHSLAFDKNGKLFFTVQNGNAIGRLDPATGKVELRPVPTPHALPYCIIFWVDRSTPYFCEFGSNKMGRIDPQTLAITEITLPEGARPRRATFGADGDIYYSDYARGFIGHVAKSGKVEEWPSPGGAGSRPYGIDAGPDGIIWYSESGVQPNTLVRFSPVSREFHKWTIPSGGGVVRNLVVTQDNHIYLACSGVNKVAIASLKVVDDRGQ
jgi:virginiamycin B lyase